VLLPTIKVKWSRYRPGVTQRVGRGIALLFHDSGTRMWWVVSSTLRPHFTAGKDPVPILQEAGWVPGPVWKSCGKSRFHRDSIPDRPARSQLLHRMSYRAHTAKNIKIIKKVKCTLVQALRLCTGRTAHRGSRGLALLFLDHGTRSVWGVSVTPWPLFAPWKDPIPILQEGGWAPGSLWTGAENLALTGIRSPDHPARSQSLYRLRYRAHKNNKHWTEMCLWRIYFAGNNSKYFGVHVKCPKFPPDFNQTRSFSTDLH